VHGINWEEARIVVCENWQRQEKAEEEIKSIKNKRDWGGGGRLIHGRSYVLVINKSVINREINM
jgi:hypothetical protein